MKTRCMLKSIAVCVMGVGLVTPGWAGSLESVNIFKNPGEKQTHQDFQPAPAEIETGFGRLTFELEAFPTEESVRKIYDEMDLQRATQAYMDFFPALSVYAIVKSHIRDFGFKTSSDIAVAVGPGWKPSDLFLTGTNSTVYTIASLDLKVDGPTVVEIPPCMYGTADDACFKFLVDFRFVGPDKGKEKNWVPTNPDKGFFLVFRFYGPTEGYIDKTWVLDDLERID